MKQTIDRYEFANQFERIRPNQFSREALAVLWDYFEEYEDDTQTEIELDVIAICCEFAESTVSELIDMYDIDVSDLTDEADIFERVGEYIEENTSYCGVTSDGSIVYVQF
jgi:hypothetical protein